jgi:hypothetical protein
MDKKSITELRNQFHSLYQNKKVITRSELIELENLYGKICYLPFDIPRFEEPKMVDWFFEKCKSITKQKADIADSYSGISLFNSINVYLDPSYKNISTIWSVNEVDNFKETFPHFYQQIHDLLPLKSIPRLNFWQSIKQIAPHRDHASCVDMPNSIRIMLYDENPRSTLYLNEDSEHAAGDRFYIQPMQDTNTFAWNNLRVTHGSDYDSKYRKILIIFNDFIVDNKKYKTLIDRSLEKYKNELLVSGADISEFCDL